MTLVFPGPSSALDGGFEARIAMSAARAGPIVCDGRVENAASSVSRTFGSVDGAGMDNESDQVL